MGISWAEMEGDDNRFSSGIPKDNKRLERSDNKPHSEEQAAMETRKRRRDAAEHFAKNFSILDALRSNLPEVFAAEILPKFDLLSTLSLAQVNKTYRDEVWSVDGVSSLEPKIKARAHVLMERAKKNGGMHGEETNETNYLNTKPMYWAVKHGNVPAVRALLASEEDVDRSLFKEYIPRFYVWDDFGPLHLAVDEGWLPVVKALIQAGANVDNLYAADDEDEHYYENSYYPHIRSETPLCLAAGNGRVDICLELIKAGADVRLNAPLRDAAAVGNLDCVQALIDAGADVNCFRLWRAPLETAAAHGHVEIVKALIQAGADVNMRDGAGRTPLFHAAGTGNDPICLMELLKAGADMNIASYPSEFEPGFEDMHTGITPLHVAACEGNESCVMLLVQAGADVRKTDRTDDRTPLSDAERGAARNDGEKKTRYKNIVQALKYAGA
jgi:cytohesin